MKRRITQLRSFEKNLNDLIAKNKVLPDDFKEFKEKLAEHPDMGPPIPSTGGVRKTRLKSASKGKRGGFRVCYLDDPFRNEIFLLVLYPKNAQEDLTNEEKKDLKQIAIILRER